MIADKPRTLADKAEVARRRALLSDNHMRPLTSHVTSLRSEGLQVPEFDPEDAGIDAKALFLFEKPGPLAASSGFISRNNDDQTAENTFNFMKNENIPRKKVAIWNVIPWWDGSIALSAKQRKDGVAAASDLVALFPKLRTIMFVGNNAALAMPHFENLPATDQPTRQIKCGRQTAPCGMPFRHAGHRLRNISERVPSDLCYHFQHERPSRSRRPNLLHAGPLSGRLRAPLQRRHRQGHTG